VAPAPSQVISRSRRKLAGIWPIADVRTSMWSVTVLLPADPVRSLTARFSPVLSHQAVSGWCPQEPLNVPAARSLSECATTKVASSRITMVLPRSRSATGEAGIAPCRATIRSHTCRRVLARAAASLSRCRSPIPSRVRHRVGSEATGPNSSPWSRSTARSDSTRPPSAIVTAVSASTRPRSCTGSNPRRASARDSPAVRPVRSASARTATDPACETTPRPATSTLRSRAHPVDSCT
jgi:hypothetical protein